MKDFIYSYVSILISGHPVQLLVNQTGVSLSDNNFCLSACWNEAKIEQLAISFETITIYGQLLEVFH